MPSVEAPSATEFRRPADWRGGIVGTALAGTSAAASRISAFRLPEDSGRWGLAAICAALIAAGVVATWLPARRALGITTSDALRAEYCTP